MMVSFYWPAPHDLLQNSTNISDSIFGKSSILLPSFIIAGQCTVVKIRKMWYYLNERLHDTASGIKKDQKGSKMLNLVIKENK